MNRPTMSDIAARAGVSKSAVSYALNGRPGVSPTTQARVLSIARELGWTANQAARVLSGAHTGVIGLMLARPAQTLGLEPFCMSFISGIEQEVAKHELGLLLQLVPDHEAGVQTYARWQGAHQVDGVIVMDLHHDDDRITPLQELRLPFVVAGDTRDRPDVTCVWTDEVDGMTQIVDYLAALGHRRVGHVGGPEVLRHSQQRAAAFHGAADRLGLDVVGQLSDYTDESSTHATRQLLTLRDRPTAIVYDNDVMAVAALSVADEMGIEVPRQLSIVSWDDSVLTRLTHPALTALAHDVMGYGAHVARRLREVIDGAAPRAHRDTPHVLAPRGSTSPPQ